MQQPSKGVLRIEAKESRIGKAPIPVPKGVTVNLDGQSLTVKGPLGELARTYPREVKLTSGSDGVITVERAVESRKARQMHGLFRYYSAFQSCSLSNTVVFAFTESEFGVALLHALFGIRCC